MGAWAGRMGWELGYGNTTDGAQYWPLGTFSHTPMQVQMLDENDQPLPGYSPDIQAGARAVNRFGSRPCSVLTRLSLNSALMSMCLLLLQSGSTERTSVARSPLTQVLSAQVLHAPGSHEARRRGRMASLSSTRSSLMP